jgi:hypothetical protein
VHGLGYGEPGDFLDWFVSDLNCWKSLANQVGGPLTTANLGLETETYMAFTKAQNAVLTGHLNAVIAWEFTYCSHWPKLHRASRTDKDASHEGIPAL